jgi:hypothetical protein
VKKLLLCSILGLFSTAQSAEIEWEWVRIFEQGSHQYSHKLSQNIVLHLPHRLLTASKDRFSEAPFFLSDEEIGQILSGELPERYAGYIMEYGSGNGEKEKDVIIKTVY